MNLVYFRTKKNQMEYVEEFEAEYEQPFWWL